MIYQPPSFINPYEKIYFAADMIKNTLPLTPEPSYALPKDNNKRPASLMSINFLLDDTKRQKTDSCDSERRILPPLRELGLCSSYR